MSWNSINLSSNLHHCVSYDVRRKKVAPLYSLLPYQATIYQIREISLLYLYFFFFCFCSSSSVKMECVLNGNHNMFFWGFRDQSRASVEFHLYLEGDGRTTSLDGLDATEETFTIDGASETNKRGVRGGTNGTKNLTKKNCKMIWTKVLYFMVDGRSRPHISILYL